MEPVDTTTQSKIEPFTWLQMFGGVMVFNTFNFLIGYYALNDVSIVDIGWGLMFLIPNSMILSQKTEFGPVHILTMSLVVVWAIRLSGHIGSRHNYGKEDYRYVAMREKIWNKFGPLAPLACYLQVFGLQGFFSMFVNSSAMHILTYAEASDPLGPFEIGGALLWLTGFLFETIGDLQL